jgi:hypothetical protein
MTFRQKIYPQEISNHLGIGAIGFLLGGDDGLEHLRMGHFQINDLTEWPLFHGKINPVGK